MVLWKRIFTEKILLLILVLATIANIVVYTVINPIVLHMAIADVRYRDVKNSKSMSPLIDKDIFPDLMTKTVPLEQTDTIYLGKIYIYEREGQNKTSWIIHRLVGVYETSDGDLYIFKGDNNEVVDDPVYRNQILEEVVGVSFG